ncbi:MAG: hypothetical protein PHY80_00120 [Rickettsiales bacterium]|nr:hypothetical protein [Rickettsiales bacterium]
MAKNKVKHKKKTTVDTKLGIFKNIKDTFKYYLKNIFYIIAFNLIVLVITEIFFVNTYTLTISRLFSVSTFNIVYYGLPIFILYVFKSIFFSDILYSQKYNTISSLMEAFGMSFKRFLPVCGTTIFFLVVISFFGLFLILPGILFLFYYFFSIYLCGLGDVNNKENSEVVLLNGINALSRSYNLVKGNLFRFMFLTLIIGSLTYFAERSLISYIFKLNIGLNDVTKNIISFSVYDIIIIYTISVFLNLEKIEADVKEEEDEAEAEERALMMQNALENKNKLRK